MDKDEKLAIKNAVNLYEQTGIGAYTTVQRLADLYIGNGEKREELLKRIKDNERTERISIELMFGREQVDWIMKLPRYESNKLIRQAGYILELAWLYLVSRLKNPRETRTSRDFIDDLVKD